jgi:hypothetical protein
MKPGTRKVTHRLRLPMRHRILESSGGFDFCDRPQLARRTEKGLPSMLHLSLTGHDGTTAREANIAPAAARLYEDGTEWAGVPAK